MSCVRPEKECPELPDPDHGQVHLTGRHFQVEIETYKDTAEKYSPLSADFVSFRSTLSRKLENNQCFNSFHWKDTSGSDLMKYFSDN